jgi:dipeptidyl aminopeptidase/acylaminoacyl peptidase
MRIFYVSLYVVALLFAPAAYGQRTKSRPNQRGVTVADAIQMRRLGDPAYFGGSSKFNVANFSPDGKRFIVIVTKGNLEQNTNQYALLLFRTSLLFNSPKPEVLLKMSSSSNREGIKDLKWLSDNETVVFIGENLRDSPQVYALNIRTKRLERLTSHPTPIVAFDTTEKGDELIFQADPPEKRVMDTAQARRDGIVVTTQLLKQLLAGDCYRFVPTFLEGEQVLIQPRGKPSIRVPLDDVAAGLTELFSMSPGGRYALIEAFVRDVPKAWQDYDNRIIHESALEQQERGRASILRRYTLVDVRTGEASHLLDAPAGFHERAAVWAPDGRSLVLSGAYLPFDVVDPIERERRRKNTYVVEVRLPSKNISVITDEKLSVTEWDRKTGRITLAPTAWDNHLPPAAYEKSGSEWKEVALTPYNNTMPNGQVKVTLEEDSNTPPKIYATDRKTQQKVLLLDLNPQFDKLRFGTVEEISWNARDGHKVGGGLYFPPDYVPGMRYPLVIQTHGFDRSRFYIDGPWSSAFAAQPLAAKGFMVLQLQAPEAELGKVGGTSQEAPYEMAEYEGAIDYLDRRGLIDRSRVGIIGFSLTVYIVEYTLTHSKYRFAAATLADGVNGGYFSYVVTPNGTDERVNGGPPFGEALSLWLQNSPGFNLDRVTTPVRLEYYGSSATVLGGWEWFSILSHLKKPVDMIYLPYAPHELVKPWERMTSQQGNVDWFRFWLKGEEDPDRTKREQYVRWHHLRDLEGQNDAKSRD